MKNQATLKVKVEKTGEGLEALIRFRPDLKKHAGEEARVKLTLRCRTRHSNPVNKNVELLKQSFTVNEPLRTLRYKCPSRLFTYEGSWIRLVARVSIVVGDDRFLEHFEVPLEVGDLNISDDLPGTIHPPDEFSVPRNFFLLAGANRQIIILLLAVMGIISLVGVSLIIAVHEIGDGSGAWDMLLGIVVLIAGYAVYACWKKVSSLFIPETGLKFIIPAGLSMRYKSKAKISRKSRFTVSDWLTGIAETDLHGVRLRVVAANIERGSYRKKIYGRDPDSGFLGLIGALFSNNEEARLVRKQKSVINRAIVLYDKTVDHLPAGASVAGYFNEPLDFEPVFTDLYPPDLVITGRRAPPLPRAWNITSSSS